MPTQPTVQYEKLVLWNNNARCAAESRQLRDTIASEPSVQLVETASEEDAQQRAKAAVEAGVPMIVAAGGDGSVHSLLQGLVQTHSKTTLGILPLGTGNDLCRTLRIPLDPWAAWETLMMGRTAAIDLTRVSTPDGTSRYFSNSANGGNSSRLLECLDERMKQDWGTWAYLRAAVHVLADMQTYQVKLSLNGEAPIQHSIWNVVLANGKTAGGGMQIAPRASVSDGLLDVILILEGTPLELAELATDLLAGDYMDHERVIYRRAHKLRLEIEPAIELVVDGEVLPGHQFEFEVVPKALDMVVGADFSASDSVSQ